MLSAAASVGVVATVINDIKFATQLESYYDNWGLCLSIAVLKGNTIVLSSKHWIYNYYIELDLPDAVGNAAKPGSYEWSIVKTVAAKIGRELTRNDDHQYVYITNLSRAQTGKVYDEFIEEIRRREIAFDISDQIDAFGWNLGAEVVPYSLH